MGIIPVLANLLNKSVAPDTAPAPEPSVTADQLMAILSNGGGASAGSPSMAPSTPPAASAGDMASNVQRLMAIPEIRKMYESQDTSKQNLGAEMYRSKQLATPEGQVVAGTGVGDKPGLAGSMPQMRFTPAQNPILRVLQSLALSTAPGRAIEDRQFAQPRQAWRSQTAATAQAIQDIKDQAGITNEQLKATGSMSLGAGNLAIKQQKADSYQTSVQNRMQVALRGLDLKALATGSQIELNKARIALDNMLTQLGPQRLELEQYGIDTNNATRQAIANTMSQLGMDKSHPVAQMIDSILGTGFTPAAPQTPAGAQPVTGPSPLPKKKGAPGSSPNNPIIIK